jgi:GT2 family glycosyltransferase
VSHHLHAALVSYNRVDLTVETLDSWRQTTEAPGLTRSLVIVDNGSSPATIERLLGERWGSLLLLGHNHFPGYATNRGWSLMPPETTLLQRIDNDTRFLPGWTADMLAAFDDPAVGQFGPIAAGDEELIAMPVWPVGGNSIIRREVYDSGVRYHEEPWSPGFRSDDSALFDDIRERGWKRAWGSTPGIVYLTDGDVDYYEETHRIRGLIP